MFLASQAIDYLRSRRIHALLRTTLGYTAQTIRFFSYFLAFVLTYCRPFSRKRKGILASVPPVLVGDCESELFRFLKASYLRSAFCHDNKTMLHNFPVIEDHNPNLRMSFLTVNQQKPLITVEQIYGPKPGPQHRKIQQQTQAPHNESP